MIKFDNYFDRLQKQSKIPVQKNNQSVPQDKEKRILFIFYVYVYIAQNKSNLIENLIKTISEYEIT